MADIISLQELADAKLDAQTLEDAVNGEPGKLIKSRTGREFYSLASVPQINTMTREEIDTAVASRAPQATTYTKTEVDLALSLKASQSNTYTKAGVDTTFAAYVGGRKAYTTLALAQAAQSSLPANTAIEVTNDGANNGTYQWNGTTLTKSVYDPLTQAKSYADANSMFKPKTYATAVDCNDLTAYGTHTFLNSTAWNGSTNRPEQTAQWGHVLVFPTTANVITQVAIMGNVTKTFAMRLRTDTGVWQSWGYFHSFDKIVELIKADINSILNTQRTSSTVNLLDPSKVTLNYEVRPDGTVLNVANSAVSGLIYCFNKESIYVSGLQSNNTAPRWYRFLNQNGSFISGGYLATGVNKGYIPVPVGAYSFQINLKSSNNTNPIDTSTAQIEFGTAKTAFVAFAPGAITHINNLALVNTQFSLNSAASGKNLFDKSTALIGFEVYNDGRVLAQATSIASAPILVKGLSNITVSGLVQNPELVRYGAFKDSSGVVLSVVQISQTATSATFTVPANAKTFQVSIKQRSTSTPDLNVIQVESGTNATAYEEYKRGFSELNGVPVVAQSTSSQATQTSRAFGAKYLMFGDSITQTSNVDTGDVTSSTYRSNWPKFAKDQLKMGGFKNYARSGASFLETGSSQADWQKISYQVQTAITNAENPDVIVLACGTNDANIKLGTYDTAMSKAIADLDRTYTAEAMRWALYKIKENFPNAVCFYCTQLQRADVETTDRETANNLMVKLAKRYGFNIIDCMNESGIVKDFEFWQANGRYLSDGLHPNVSGQQVQSNLIVSQIIERMTY